MSLSFFNLVNFEILPTLCEISGLTLFRNLIDWMKAKFRGDECLEDFHRDADHVIQTHQCKAVSSNEAITELVYICVKVRVSLACLGKASWSRLRIISDLLHPFIRIIGEVY